MREDGSLNFDYIFVLTYGRSGSTLLQGVLNSIPGMVIRGENNGALRGLIRSWNFVNNAKHKFAHAGEGAESAWYGIGDVNVDQYGRDLAQAFVSNVLRPNKKIKTVGFKEIRYLPPHCNIAEETEFMRRFFPRAGFIVNTRNLDDTYSSTQKAKHATTKEQLEQGDRVLRAFCGRGASDVFHVHYDDYKKDVDALRPLFDFLGARFSRKKIETVMSREHSVQMKRQSKG